MASSSQTNLRSRVSVIEHMVLVYYPPLGAVKVVSFVIVSVFWSRGDVYACVCL